MSANDSTTDPVAADSVPSVRFAANAVRLTAGQWLIAVALIAIACWLIPFAWKRAEPLDVDASYRLPYPLGLDYWTYERACNQICEDEVIPLVGDSVLWGHYVDCDGTLAHYLNKGRGEPRFATLAVDGIHPVALAGLVRYYGAAIRDKRVIVNCNLLWISSPRHDLTAEKEAPFNHTALVPQITTRIPCYEASASERVGIVISRQVGILCFADHLRIAYYDSDDLATWTIDRPYENPWGPLAADLPAFIESPSPTADRRPWSEKRIRPVSPDWVPLDVSLQWKFFRQTVELLQQRGNEVFVFINPLNEHMMTAEGLLEYKKRRRQVIAWHVEQDVPCWAPTRLPSEEYADLSHPVAAGYARLAKQLLTEKPFLDFLGDQ